MRRFLISAATIFFLGGHAFGEDYKLISSNKAQMILADADSEVTRSRNTAKLWSIVLRAPNHFLPDEIAIVKVLDEFDCVGNKWRQKAMVMYRSDYSLVKNDSVPNAPWRQIPPDTQNSELKKFVCGATAFRRSRPSIGRFPLSKIIASVYAGPWPVE